MRKFFPDIQMLATIKEEKNANSLISEIEIIQSIADGEEKVLTVLYDLYSEKVYNTALSYTKKEEDAEEITQDVFMKIHKSAATFKRNSSVSTWIYRIAVNTSLNYLKKRIGLPCSKTPSPTPKPSILNTLA